MKKIFYSGTSVRHKSTELENYVRDMADSHSFARNIIAGPSLTSKADKGREIMYDNGSSINLVAKVVGDSITIEVLPESESFPFYNAGLAIGMNGHGARAFANENSGVAA